PGIVVGLAGPQSEAFASSVSKLMEAAPAGAMLHRGIQSAYAEGVKNISAIAGVRNSSTTEGKKTGAIPTVFTAGGETFLKNPRLGEELFGPSTVVLTASSREQLMEIARRLDGHLT